MYNVLDLFCGAGGLSEGFSKIKEFNIVAGIDIWQTAIDTYNLNHKHLGLCHDLTKLTPEELDNKLNKKIDIIVSCSPCQGFSIAGKRDKNDPRNSLFMYFVKYLDYFKPKAFIMENVIGLLSMKTENNEKCIDIIMTYLSKNYNCIICKLYASDFGVPQYRRRVIIFGISKELGIIPTSPTNFSDTVPVSSVIEPREKIDNSYFLSEKAINGIIAKKAKSARDGKGFGAQFIDLSKPCYTIPARYWKDGYDALIKYSDTEIRRLTILELKRIQSFPESYVFIGSKKDIIIQIGNSVAPRFAECIGRHLLGLLS